MRNFTVLLSAEINIFFVIAKLLPANQIEFRKILNQVNTGTLFQTLLFE